MAEIYYKIALFILQTSFMIIKIYLTKKYVQKKGQGNNYPKSINIFLGFNALMLLLPYFYIIGFIDQFSLNLHFGWRVLGILDFVLVIMVMIWQMRHLDVNISSTHEERTLIQSGPYEYVRHPLYLLFIIMTIDGFLISANLILLIAIPITIIAGKIRANYEENILINEYGEEYQTYKKQTGQLFPKLW